MASDGVKRRRAVACLAAIACVAIAPNCFAVQVEFQLVGPNSLAAAPYVNLILTPMNGQDPGNTSLTTTYSGTVTVDVDDLINPTTITFVSANAVAAISGDWLPEVGGGSEGDPNIDGDATPGTAAPANYGFFLDAGVVGQLYAASRDTVWSLNAAARSITGGQFDPFGIEIEIAQGTYHANLSSILYGDGAESDDLTGETGTNCTNEAGTDNRCGANMGSYSVANDLITLTLPLDFIMSEGGDPEVGFTGTLTATYSLELPLLGDYNDDLKIDVADYALWRDLVGSSTMLPNDDIGGTIGLDHYEQWANSFGGMSGEGIGATTVPEPAAATLVSLGIVGLWLRRRAARSLAKSENANRRRCVA